MRFRAKFFLCFCIFGSLIFTGLTSAAISIIGVADKATYTDSVSFTVNSEAGWDYTSMLNHNQTSTSVATGDKVVVDKPDYMNCLYTMSTRLLLQRKARRFGLLSEIHHGEVQK